MWLCESLSVGQTVARESERRALRSEGLAEGLWQSRGTWVFEDPGRFSACRSSRFTLRKTWQRKRRLRAEAFGSPVESKARAATKNVKAYASSDVQTSFMARSNCSARRLRKGLVSGSSFLASCSYLVDPASSHMLVSKIKPCMSKYKHSYCETANGSLNQLSFI